MTWFKVWIEINSVCVSGGIGGHRNLLVFRVGIEIDMKSMLRSKINSDLVRGIEIDLVLVWALLFVRGSELTWFCLRAENDFVFSAGID